MAEKSIRIWIRIDNNLLERMKKKTKKMCFGSVQEYLLFLARRDLFTGRKGAGRPLTGIASDVAVLTSHKPIFTEEKEWFKKKKK